MLDTNIDKERKTFFKSTCRSNLHLAEKLQILKTSFFEVTTQLLSRRHLTGSSKTILTVITFFPGEVITDSCESWFCFES